MEAGTLGTIESYDYEKWKGSEFVPQTAARDGFSSGTQWGQGTVGAHLNFHSPSSGAAWGPSQDHDLFNQPFYSESAWAPAATKNHGGDAAASTATNQTQTGSPSNIWASPNQHSQDEDSLLYSWNQQCRITDASPEQQQQQQQYGGIIQVISKSHSSSTESSGMHFQGTYSGFSPLNKDQVQNKINEDPYGMNHFLPQETAPGLHSQGPPDAGGFLYYNPPTPTSLPGLYGASSGSTNTNSTTAPPAQPSSFAAVSTPSFARSRSAPVDFDTPVTSYENHGARRYSLLENSLQRSASDDSTSPSTRNAMLLEPSSLHIYRETYDSSAQPQARRGSRSGNRGMRQRQPHSDARSYNGNSGPKLRGSPPLKENNSLRRSPLGSSLHQVADTNDSETLASSEAIRQLMKPAVGNTDSSISTLNPSFLTNRNSRSMEPVDASVKTSESYPILPQQPPPMDDLSSYYYDDITNSFSEEEDDAAFLSNQLEDSEFDPDGDESFDGDGPRSNNPYGTSPSNKNREWLMRMNRKLQETPVGELDPAVLPLPAIMNVWAKTKSAQGASMVEMWLKRVLKENGAGNERVVPSTKMFTMAVDAWARSGEGGAAAQRAEALLQQMHELYQSGKHESLRPTTGMFNAVINSWARSREKIAPVRAEQILDWMQNLQDLDVQPDKYTFNTVIHSYAKAGGAESASKAQELLQRMQTLYQEGNVLVKPDTISYNVVINALAKAGRKGAADEAEKLLGKMHQLHEMGDPDVKPNVVTYGAVIDSFAKSGEPDAASRADRLLANMIQLYQTDPIQNAGLMPNTYVFNTVINCWSKSKERDAASKAEEMLVAMSRLHASGMPSLKPDAFTYTAVIDSWAKSGFRGAAARADQLLDKMEAKYLAGDTALKPNTFTYNAVINALAKSGEAGAAARAERVLQNMVNRHRNGGGDEVKPTTINFNTVLDAWAKSGGGRAAAERAEEILEWMDRLHKSGNTDVRPDTITFNAVLDAWARSGDRMAPRRAEQILDHMDELYRAGNKGVKPDTYTYNTLINCWAKSGERGAAARAEHVLQVMEKRHRDGDPDFKPNTRTHTSVIDAWAKSGERGAARRAEQILNGMIARYEATKDPDIKPNVHTANAVCNACAFSKKEEDRTEALQIAFRVFDWLSRQPDMEPDSYTYTILLSVCANLIPRDDSVTRFAHARAFFESCRNAGYVNDYVLRKLRQTVTDDEYLGLVEYRTEPSAASMPSSWTRNVKLDTRSHGRRGGHGSNHANNGHDSWSSKRRGKY